MCLSVYLGTTRPIAAFRALPDGLGIERAGWTPPPLRSNHPFVYYLGRQGRGAELECSCLLAEQVEWTDEGPSIQSDPLAADAPLCPFDALRAICDEATRDGGFATLVCDDSGGVAQDAQIEDYCTGAMVRLHTIARGNLLFADASGAIPSRVFHVVR
jgi:hypothetical protein